MMSSATVPTAKMPLRTTGPEMRRARRTTSARQLALVARRLESGRAQTR